MEQRKPNVDQLDLWFGPDSGLNRTIGTGHAKAGGKSSPGNPQVRHATRSTKRARFIQSSSTAQMALF
ncbi:hypothetical protein [Pseudoxanthomonas sp.]|uniref:hypothetical protein n=1 Tax=Pseudoxanthomonas sp. TaxID=1871049 RepID=UPI002617573A|nr:hypothetical protein [Pseudoxanthomonas sp.]WDS36885.1 MAG: hypothetical protein O8I58_02965 [Pseudoxanthomonas sp.]